MWVYYYLGIGLPALIAIFLWRKDMWSMVKNGIRDMGMIGLWYWMAVAVVVVLLWLMWILVLVLAIRRQIRGRLNVPEGEEEPPVAIKKREPKAGEVITKEQIQQLENQISISSPGAVRGQLKETLRKKAYVFIRAKKKEGQKEVTVNEVLFNVDKSPEFLALCVRIGYPRSDMVNMCIKLGAVDKNKEVREK